MERTWPAWARWSSSSSLLGTVRLWDVADRAHPLELTTLRHDLQVCAVAFTGDGRTLASVDPGGQSNLQSSVVSTMRLWDMTDRAHPAAVATLRLSGSASAVAFTGDGRTLAGASEDGTVRLWDMADRAHPVGLATLRHDGHVVAIAFTGDGRTLAARVTMARCGSGIWRIGPTQSNSRRSITTAQCPRWR